MHHTSIVYENLDNILGPNFNQVLLDHSCNINCILHILQSINSSQELFANWKNTNRILKRVLVDQTPTITYKHCTICLYEHLCFFYNLNLYLVFYIIEKHLAYIMVKGKKVGPLHLWCHLHHCFEACGLSYSGWNVCIVKEFIPGQVTLASLVLSVALRNGALLAWPYTRHPCQCW